jgi:hypothetical protein
MYGETDGEANQPDADDGTIVRARQQIEYVLDRGDENSRGKHACGNGVAPIGGELEMLVADFLGCQGASS